MHRAALTLWKVAFICGLKMQERLGLSTSCSATFRQLLVFRATFFVSSNFLHSEQFLWLASNVLVKSKLQHPPPGNPPGHLTLLKIIVQIPHYPCQNAVQMPYTRVHSGDKVPPPLEFFFSRPLQDIINTRFGTGIYQKNLLTPGTFHRHINDRRKAETPSVVEQNLYSK